MKIAELLKTSLRLRMTLGMAVMLLPLLVYGIGSYFASKSMIGSLEEVARTQVRELKPVTDLQKLVLQSAMPPNDYLILGDPSERVLYDYLQHEIDTLFEAMKTTTAFEEQEERRYIEAALGEWKQARGIGAEIFTYARPVGNQAAAQRMKSFDAHVGKAADILNLLYDEVQHEIEKQQARAHSVQRQENAFLVIVFAVALGIAVIAGFLLSRSIILPIRALQDGVFKFGQGDNSFRVVLDRRDEFGLLAETMNTMAERLEFDSLTGVYSKPEFHRRLKNELNRSLRHGHIVTLLMVDIDHFKRVNDTCGHPCGDDALRAVAMLMLKAVRSFDSVARYGGEEFAVIMPETGPAGAWAVAERLREAVASRPVTTARGNVLDLTISIGMAAVPGDARSEEDLIAAADLALYAAKERGRNRVVAYEPGLDPDLRTSRHRSR